MANGKRHPVQMRRAEVEVLLTKRATRGQVSAGTQNQALAALLFLYREVRACGCPGCRIWCAPSCRCAFQ
nr:phage integrase N-terminal SAM-like domain-containing protein [Xanthomonas sp. CFBP 8152]